MVITRLSGKWKISQNQPPQNQHSVIQGLNGSGQCEAITMAELVNAGVKNVP
jgi:transcriptional regulator